MIDLVYFDAYELLRFPWSCTVISVRHVGYRFMKKPYYKDNNFILMSTSASDEREHSGTI